MTDPPLALSIVVPVFDEAGSIEELAGRLATVRALLPPSEAVLIDDGSTDGTTQILEELHRRDPWFQVVRLTRNFGQTAALAAGFDHARGEVVVTLDADLQNDPADIPRLLAKLDEGYDVVSGWRVDRKDRFVTRRIPSAVANRLVSWTTGVRLHDYGCTLKAYRREVVESLDLYGDAHRFLPALASAVGDRVAEVPVAHHPRRHGRSKYGLSRVWKVTLDLLALPFLLRFFDRPIRFFGTIGFAMGAAGGALLGWLAYLRLGAHRAIGNRPLLTAAVLLVVMSVQFITLGLLGELVIRSYYAGRGRRAYHVRRALVGCGAGEHSCAAAPRAIRLDEDAASSRSAPPVV
ncbi:MAG: glycosyltransferase family 2 protein [Acidobacteria bacterium]|nr:glycosyltransferase family 2 protein [Acidobacteriota bacterium]